MSEPRIDAITRSLARGLPRRRLLDTASRGLAALVVGLPPIASASASCRKLGRTCRANGDCCRGSACRGGVCRCKRHWSSCGGDDKCFPLLLDPRNCGTCGNICLLGAICESGTCL